MAEIDVPFEGDLLFSAEDDRRHRPGPEIDWTETTWWSFNVPERSLGGWLYAQVRPNIGTCTGGAFVYGTGGFAAWEHPYYAWANFDRLPEVWDFDDVTFRNGVSVTMLEAGMRYKLGYRFRDQRDFICDLEFVGLTPPVPHLSGQPPFTGSSHYDQHGRITGTMQLRGETIDVDCLAVRDRWWGRRPALLGRRGRLSYAFGANETGEAFLVFCIPPSDDLLSDTETLTSGYLLRDGTLRYLANAQRHTVRDPKTGGVSSIEIHGEDTDGRALDVAGRTLAGNALPTSAHVCINSLIEWELAGGLGWGEDQDVWPVISLGDLRHAQPPAGGWA